MSAVNMEFAELLSQSLSAAGLRYACVSPGSRSGPLAIALARNPSVRTWVHVDERSSGFFALGAAKRLGQPVAVLTTSGTAAAELHPAVIEAHHSRTPLLVLTADRPPELRDRGANQTIAQAGLFAGATRWAFDPGPPDAAAPPRFVEQLAARAMAAARGPVAGPVHLNLPFREPLLPRREEQNAAHHRVSSRPVRVRPRVHPPDAADVELLLELLGSAQRPFVHAGSLPPDPPLRQALAALSQGGLVVHAEPTSQLRNQQIPGLLRGAEALLRDETFAAAHSPDLVIRLGAAPTSRTVNEWLARTTAEHVALIDPDAAWLDPDALATDVLPCDAAPLLQAVAARVRFADAAAAWRASWRAADDAASDALQQCLHELPLFEAHAVMQLARVLDAETTVVVGSSMPIRDADWFWPPGAGHRFIANRGASGIDGFVSTAMGAAAASDGERVVALCGDLSLYHDMNGLLAARRHGLSVTFVVLNNDGGGIFSFLPEAGYGDMFEELFATPTGIDLQRVASLYDLDYRSAASVDQLATALRTHGDVTTIVDVRFTRADSVSGHRALWAAASAAIHAARRAAPGT